VEEEERHEGEFDAIRAKKTAETRMEKHGMGVSMVAAAWTAAQ